MRLVVLIVLYLCVMINNNVFAEELLVDSKGRSIWNTTILLEDVTDYKSACKLMEHNKHGIAYYESLPSEQYEYAVETVAREGTVYFFKPVNLIFYYGYMEPQAGVVDNISIKDEVFTVTVNQLSTILYNIDENTIKNSKDFEKSGNLHTHTIKFIDDKKLLYDGSIRYYCQE